jgi:hypothetical protein
MVFPFNHNARMSASFHYLLIEPIREAILVGAGSACANSSSSVKIYQFTIQTMMGQ